MAHRVSTEGLSKQWKVRRLKPSTNKNPSDPELDPLGNLFETALEERASALPVARATSSFSLRPDDDGVIKKMTRPRKRKAVTSKTAGNTRGIPNVSSEAELYHELEGDPMKELQKLMEDLTADSDNECSISNWQSRQIEYEAHWLSHRLFIFNQMLRLQAPPEGPMTCDGCGCDEAVVRCFDCVGSHLCSTCDSLVHRCNPMHDRHTWANGFVEILKQEFPFPMDQPSNFKCCKCGGTKCMSESHGEYIIITLKGRFNLKKCRTKCATCNVHNPDYDLTNVLNKGFWPGNPDISKSDYLFDRKLLELWHHLHRHLPGSSLAGFIGVLNDLGSSNNRKPTINQPLFSRAAAEYGYLISEMDLIKHQDFMKCPPCSIKQHSAHVDGNHKLYRYKRVSSGAMQPYYDDRFIVKDVKVREHLHDVYSVHPSKSKSTYNDIYCGTAKWKAARETTFRNQKLDETGLVVVGCRHAVAQKAVNMHAGELYAYSHYLHINFLLEHGVDFLFQDVMCKYWPWANKVGDSNSLWQKGVMDIRPALSIFHAKAHSWHCQVCWGGRFVEGAGAGAGEDMEQAFSHLSRIGTTTKHMSTAGRMDMITDHVLYWNRRKIKGMPTLMCKRYKNVQVKIEEVEDKKRRMTWENEGKYDVDWAKWTDDVIKVAKAVHKSGGSNTTSKLLQQKYVLEQEIKIDKTLQQFLSYSSEGLSTIVGITELFELAEKQVSGLKTKERKLKDLTKQFEDSALEDIDDRAMTAAIKNTCAILQADVEMIVTSINQRREAIGGLADTSKRRATLRSKMAKDLKNLEKQLRKLCSVMRMKNSAFQPFDKEEILKSNFPWQTEDVADWSMKKNAAELHMLHKRLQEEESLLVREMHNFLAFHMHVKETLKQEIKEIQDSMEKIRSQPSMEPMESGINEEEENRSQPSMEPKECDINEEEEIRSQPSMEPMESDINERDLCMRYNAGKITDPSALNGIIAMKRQGIVDTIQQIQHAIGMFSMVTSELFKDMEFDSDDELDGDEYELESEQEGEETEQDNLQL